jgi:deoxycytidylate deaminase
VNQSKKGRTEIFIGLVGATGTDLMTVRNELRRSLAGVGYETEEIKVSNLIAEAFNLNSAADPPKEDIRIKKLMDAGDHLRKSTDRGDGVLPLVFNTIRKIRLNRLYGSPLPPGSDESAVCENVAYIIDSLKHPDEVASLRRAYGDKFILISAYEPKPKRLGRLIQKIANTHNDSALEKFRTKAEELIDIDEIRNGGNLAQNVRDTYYLADFFVAMENDPKGRIGRFIEILFGHPFLTPTADEYWMFHARGAALRSADLSRQVGAVITSTESEFVASGCNEVPMAGGGAYWDGKPGGHDDRDFKHEIDANSVMRHEIIREFVEGLEKSKLLAQSCDNLDSDQLTHELLHGAYKSALSDARIRNLIEFGRIVHAEMSAITEAARRGLSTLGGDLYCTTFPCHMCARHIIAAGIRRVVYIEPYPKSLTRQLYSKSTIVDGEGGEAENSVEFVPFSGVAPRVFERMFAAVARKDDMGKATRWDGQQADPRGMNLTAAYVQLESEYSKRLSVLDFTDLNATFLRSQGESSHV